MASPLYFLSIVPFFLLASSFGIDVQMKEFFYGALGWWLALLLRVPFIFYHKAKGIQSNTLITAISGPTEEVTRYILLLILGVNIHVAYSVGLGWAAIEIIYGLVQVVGIGVLEQKEGPEADEAKAMMRKMGMDKTFASSTPFWGALERFSANAIHIGFSILLVFSPYFLVISIPFHSAINFYVVWMNKRSIAKSQIGLLLLGSLLFIASTTML